MLKSLNHAEVQLLASSSAPFKQALASDVTVLIASFLDGTGTSDLGLACGAFCYAESCTA